VTVKEPVLFRDNLKRIYIIRGLWQCRYTGLWFWNSRKLDVDHIIPLKYADEHGGASWSARKKEQFANDLENLIPVSAGANRGKGARGPTEWLPTRREGNHSVEDTDALEISEDINDWYLRRWIYLEEKYGLRPGFGVEIGDHNDK